MNPIKLSNPCPARSRLFLLAWRGSSARQKDTMWEIVRIELGGSAGSGAALGPSTTAVHMSTNVTVPLIDIRNKDYGNE